MVAEGVVLEGGCLCGAIRYTLTGPSQFVGQCCCLDCKKASGTGHTTIICMPKNQLVVKGKPTAYTSKGYTGAEVTRNFCGTCGGRLYTTYGDFFMVQAGSLDDCSTIKPQNVIYMKDAAPWDHFDPAIPKFEGMPPNA